jgi:hypothetical protein
MTATPRLGLGDDGVDQAPGPAARGAAAGWGLDASRLWDALQALLPICDQPSAVSVQLPRVPQSARSCQVQERRSDVDHDRDPFVSFGWHQVARPPYPGEDLGHPLNPPGPCKLSRLSRLTMGSQDTAYWGVAPEEEVVTAWIALSDVPPPAGPVVFAPGTHAGPCSRVR